ncbi:TetR/AcrR family transcriptional regulator [Nocardia sp. NPDC059239]|uniref:TetR/AcrR family transcriptional regulator n=1 Tax=unclassified Nocardia TaxID=2637762 RepID=UPI00369653F3
MATTDFAQRSGEAARTRIVEVAFEHFAQHGFRGGSLAKIAAEAGISQSGLLHHFPSKAALLQAVLGARDLQDLQATATRPEDLQSMTFEDLLTFLTRVIANNENNRNVIRLAHLTAAEATGPNHPAFEWVTLRLAFMRSVIESAVQRGIEQGQVRADAEVPQIAGLIIAVIDGLESQWLIDPSIDMSATFAHYCNDLRRSLTP